MPAAELPACVFCGQPIAAGEETAGRAPMAAHAVCADAALADDEHWDAISAGTGSGSASSGEPDAGSTTARRLGCLAITLLAVLVALVAVPALG
ncbi:MAG TPA: hypothetical protein VF071_04675 [Candidatus Limnocylindria bacterium]